MVKTVEIFFKKIAFQWNRSLKKNLKKMGIQMMYLQHACIASCFAVYDERQDKKWLFVKWISLHEPCEMEFF